MDVLTHFFHPVVCLLLCFYKQFEKRSFFHKTKVRLLRKSQSCLRTRTEKINKKINSCVTFFLHKFSSISCYANKRANFFKKCCDSYISNWVFDTDSIIYYFYQIIKVWYFFTLLLIKILPFHNFAIPKVMIVYLILTELFFFYQLKITQKSERGS